VNCSFERLNGIKEVKRRPAGSGYESIHYFAPWNEFGDSMLMLM
jgi:hypothetical protein